MADVYVRFSTNRIVRTMEGADGGANVDLDADGQMVGVLLFGAVSVTIDGHALPFHEWECPTCGMTTRARMAG